MEADPAPSTFCCAAANGGADCGNQIENPRVWDRSPSVVEEARLVTRKQRQFIAGDRGLDVGPFVGAGIGAATAPAWAPSWARERGRVVGPGDG